jgi:hypothetical protein
MGNKGARGKGIKEAKTTQLCNTKKWFNHSTSATYITKSKAVGH